MLEFVTFILSVFVAMSVGLGIRLSNEKYMADWFLKAYVNTGPILVCFVIARYAVYGIDHSAYALLAFVLFYLNYTLKRPPEEKLPYGDQNRRSELVSNKSATRLFWSVVSSMCLAGFISLWLQ